MPASSPSPTTRSVSGTYTGNSSGSARNITVGFKCAFVYIKLTDAADSALLTEESDPEGCFFNSGPTISRSVDINLNAPDGFNVGGATHAYNLNANIYHYSAIEEP